ncbi:MAG: hypothetical protein M0R51_15605 [Clostridia bacterium]|nr:hypothetical protein [Clostridia bacterium]
MNTKLPNIAVYGSKVDFNIKNVSKSPSSFIQPANAESLKSNTGGSTYVIGVCS